MRTLLLSCCLISLAVTGFGQTSGARNSAAFSDEQVVIRMNGYQLAGTLSLPRGARRPVPAVVLITGSGQQTRDEAIPIPGLENYRPFRQIAEHLVARGIAALRVDDRGMGGSTGKETLTAATTSSFAEDTDHQHPDPEEDMLEGDHPRAVSSSTGSRRRSFSVSRKSTAPLLIS